MRKMDKDNTTMKRVVSLCLFITIMVLYISIQLYWGLNLYKAFDTEEKKGLGDLLSNVISSYAGTTLAKSADNPDTPVFTMERISPDNDSVLSNAIVTEVIKKPEELTSILEKVLIVASIKSDSLFIDRLAQSFEQELLNKNVYSFDLYLRVNGTITNKTSIRPVDSAFPFFSITTEAEKKFEVEGETYVIGITQKAALPKSIRILAYLFIVGILLLVFILYLLIKMTQKVEFEERVNHEQERFFYGLVHDLKLPLSLAHSLIDGLTSDGDISKKTHAGLIEADNHILKLSDDINMLLSMHRLKQNKKSESRQIYLYDIVQDITVELKAHYPEKDISFSFEFPYDLSIVFPAEELKLILRVFFDNAVKYSQDAAPKITVKTKSDEHSVFIEIEDEGRGIRLFNDNRSYDLNQFQIMRICKDGNGGIGLMTAWTILNSKGGKITYSKIHPTGSLFTLSIPIEQL